MIVVDASVAVVWFIEQPQSAAAQHFLETTSDIVAPRLLELELANVLVRYVRSKALSEKACLDKLERLLPKLVTLLDTEADGRLAAAFKIAAREGGAVYDAAYIALAKALGVALVTADRQQAMIARKAEIETRFIAAS